MCGTLQVHIQGGLLEVQKYDEIKTLSMYKNFKEAYDEPPRNVNIQRERQILTSLFFATEGYKWNKDITHKMIFFRVFIS